MGASEHIAATLTKATSRPGVTASRALARNGLRSSAQRRLTGTVLADVTMPNDYSRGKAIRDLPWWVFVFTFPKALDPSFGPPPGVTPATPSPSSLVWHSVVIVVAENGDFVRGFFTK